MQHDQHFKLRFPSRSPGRGGGGNALRLLPTRMRCSCPGRPGRKRRAWLQRQAFACHCALLWMNKLDAEDQAGPGTNDTSVTCAIYWRVGIYRAYADNMSCLVRPAWLSECWLFYKQKIIISAIWSGLCGSNHLFFWVDCQLCLQGHREPFHSACTRKQMTFLGHYVPQSRMLLTAADGGASTNGGYKPAASIQIINHCTWYGVWSCICCICMCSKCWQ